MEYTTDINEKKSYFQFSVVSDFALCIPLLYEQLPWIFVIQRGFMQKVAPISALFGEMDHLEESCST